MTRMRRGLLVAVLLLASSCVYFNAMYDTRRDYDRAVESRRAGSDGIANTHYDSVIARAGRIVSKHPDSEHAAPAALLKARSEIARRKWQDALETAAGVAALTDDPELLGLAAGLEGIARGERRDDGDLPEAERLLTLALEADPEGADRALFHFHRGLVRLASGEAERAVADLEAASSQEALTPEVRLDLARGLAEAGQYEAAVKLTAELVRENRFASFAAGMDPHLDTLVRKLPAAIESAFGEQLEESDVSAIKRGMLLYYRGLAREIRGDDQGALAAYDSARSGGEGRYAAEAAYRWGRLRIRTAERPAHIDETREALMLGRGVPEAEVSSDAARLGAAVEEFTNLVEAYETRGATAAEAALRAAEIAGADLGARRVARGLYLRYLELAPDSRWRAKAIGGAMLYADAPAGAWAEDHGPATDQRLRARLTALPATDPYRVSIQDLPRDAGIDSAYVDAERDLERRLIEIRMLYDTTAVLVQPTDTLAPADEQDEDEEPQDQPDLEF